MNFNSVFEELDKLYEEEKVEKPERVEGEVKEEPVEEGCTKTLTEADEEEIEFAEEPVEVLPEEADEEASEEEIPEETADTVEDFIKGFDEYDGKLKLEFKPIVIDGKEYPVTSIMWDDTEEGKLVAEIIFDAPVEEAEETVDEVEESLTESAVKKSVFVDFTGSNSAFENAYRKQLEKDGLKSEAEVVEDSRMKSVVAAVNAGEDVILYTVNDDYKSNCSEIINKENFKVVMVSRDSN